jgi:hypothetical protein
LSLAGSARLLVEHVIATGCFGTSAPKTENGFVAQQNCFVGLAGRNKSRKNSMNSAATSSLEGIRLTRKTGHWGHFCHPSMDEYALVHWPTG